MAKDPAVLFYTSDFLTGTMTMTDEHVGMYIRLLCLQHQKVRLTEKDMLFICKAYVPDVFDKFKKDGDGLYFNKRLDDEASKRREYSESRRRNSSKKSIEKPKAYAEHMENENENENKAFNTKKRVFKKPPGLEEGEKIKRLEKNAAPPPKEWRDTIKLLANKKSINSATVLTKNVR